MTEFHFPTEEDLDVLVRETPVFDASEVKRRTLSRIQKGEEPINMKKRAFFRGLLIAAIICVLSVSAVAVANYVMDGRIADALGIKAAKAEELRTSGQNVDLVCQDSGTTMTILQTLGDQNALYVLVRFDFPESVDVSEEMTFREIFADFNGSGGWSYDLLEHTDHTATYLLEIDTEESLTGRQFRLFFRDYGRFVPEEDENGNPIDNSALTQCDGTPIEDGFCAAVKGSWEQTWLLQYEDSSETWKLQQEITLGDEAMTLTGVRISSLSASFTMIARDVGETGDYGAIYAKDGAGSGLDLSGDDLLKMHYADGSVRSVALSSAGAGWEGTAFSARFLFDEVIETENLTAVTMGGVEIPLI